MSQTLETPDFNLPLKDVDDSQEVKKRYRYWRMRVFFSIYIGYALFYFTRKSFTFVMPALVSELGLEKSQLGFLGSLLSISYGISKFLSGVISDRSNLRYFMGIGLALTGVFNIFFGLSSTVVFFAIFLGLNGLFQGWGAPPCAKLLTSWYSQKERGRWWGVWNTSHNMGGALIPILCAMAIGYFGWRYALFFPGIAAIFFGICLINRLRDTPAKVGLPSIEEFQNDHPEGEETKNEESLSTKAILVEHVLKNRYIWLLAIAFFFVYVIRTAINDWVQLFLMEERQCSLLIAGSCVFWFEIGGIFGSLVAGWLSDTVFKGKRGPVNVIFSFGIIAILLVFWLIPLCHIFWISAVMFCIGFLIFGPQMLIGMAAAELATKKAAGTATGFAGLFAYIGAATAGWPIGKITQEYGWSGFFILLTLCALMSVILLFPLWSRRMVSKLAISS